MLGCPLDSVPHVVHPLYQRYLCWKHGLGSGGSLWNVALCPYILEMCQIMADAKGKRLADYFAGTVYLQTPLKLGRTEAEQFVFFADKGLRVGISHMMSSGGTGPATLAGAITVWLAETLLIHFIQRAFFGTRNLHFGCSISVLDMKRGMYPYGRPERPLANVIMAQLARHYGASFTGHGGHSDAKVPSCEAGAQKALTCIPILMACGRCNVSAGLLSVDEVFSPIQMILDNEFVGALKRFARGCEISDEACAVDVIKQVGPGGNFLDTDHTASLYRKEHWQPTLWSREMLTPWLEGDRKTDIERALDIYHHIKVAPDPPSQVSDETEKALLKVIERAKAAT
jgi:trimethylamine--corrinoid protein Co-methyltransferase